MTFTKPFEKLGKHDAAIAGGKGASLGEMTQAGIPVPPGFVIVSDSFEQFIEETDLDVEIDAILHKVDHREMHTVENASEEIRALILNADMPKDIGAEIEREFKKLGAKYVAVRSSATAEDSSAAAWAGQLDSFLNTTENDLLDKVKRCWASLFTPRAIFYRFEKELHKTKISVAVVVQKMVESEMSGIAFSVHPVTQDYNQLIIEAGFGLGEAIVSGQVTPDSYVVEKNPRNILDINVSTQDRALYRSEKLSAEHGNNEWRDIPEPKASSQVLTGKQILELSDIILNIENHYGFPCDIEWAFEKGKFYIVQSRPITTLTTDVSSKKDANQSATEYNGINWNLTVTRNMSFWHQCNSNYGLYHHTRDFGVDAQIEALFINIDGTKCSWFTYPENFSSYAKAVMNTVDSVEDIKLLKEKYEKFGHELLESLQAVLNKLTLKNWDKFIFNYRRYCAGLTITTVIGRAGSDLLISKLKEKGMSDMEIPGIIAKITYPTEYTPLFQSLLDLLKIGSEIQSKNIRESEINTKLKSWLEVYSHIPVNFCDEPWTIEDAKKQLSDLLLKDCKEEVSKAKREKDQIISESKKILQKINDKSVSVLAYAIAEGTYLNEFRKNIFSKVSLKYRSFFAEIAKRGGSKNWRDCFYLTPEEMRQIIDGQKVSLSNFVKERAVVGAYTTKDGHIDLLSTEVSSRFHDYVKSHQGQGKNENNGQKEIKGFSANIGSVKGVARIILSSKDFDKLSPGEILVTTMTSVDFVPVMGRAAAFVTNEGGITSHAAIVAREMNKPCIIGTKIATQILRDGMLVEVDADKGVVRILEDNKTQQTEDSKKKGEVTFLSDSEKIRVLRQEGAFNPELWVEQGRWIQPPFDYLFFSHLHTTSSVKRIFPTIKFHTIFSVDGYAFQNKEDQDNLYSYLKETYRAGKLSNIARALDAESTELAERLEKELNKGEKYIEAHASKILDTYKKLAGAWTVAVYVGDLMPKLAKDVGYIKTEAELFALVHPHLRETWIEKEVKAVVKIAVNLIKKYPKATLDDVTAIIKKDPELKNHLAAYIQEFAWCSISKWFGQPVDETYALNRVKEEFVNVRLGNHIKVKHEEIKESDLDGVVLLSISSAYWRAECGKINMMLAYRFRQLLEKIGKKNGVGYEHVVLLTPKEIEETLDDETYTIKNSDTIYDRQKEYFAFVTEDDEEIVLTPRDPDYKTLKDIYVSHKDQPHSGTELSGIGASPGFVKGSVRVIESAREFDVFKEGEVLVAAETSPSYVPLMRKASAILTGKGGITSHAAIVSRELKKPCVIAIKNVNKILKDGDMVEVNANNGVVRILNRNILNKKGEWVFMWSTTPIMPTYWTTAQALIQRGDVYAHGEAFCYFDGSVISAYMEKDQLEKFKREGEKYLDPSLFKKYQVKYKKENKDWWKWIRGIEKKDYSKIKISDLIEDHTKYIEFARDSIAYFGSTRTEFTYAAEQKLEEIIKKHYGDKWPDVFGVLTTAVVLDDIQKEYLEWLKMLSTRVSDKKLLNHASKYPWLIFGQFDDVKVLEFLKNRMKAEKGIFAKESQRLKKAKTDLKNEQDKIFKKFGNDATQGKYLANFLQTQSVERMNIKSYWAGSYYLARNMWFEIAKKTNLPLWDLLGFVVPPETEQLLGGKFKQDIQTVIRDRKKSHALVVSEENLRIVDSKEADILFKRRIKKVENADNTIKGQTAMLGVVRGKVRKVIAGDLDMLQNNIKEFKHGEILVTSMTQPNMMVLAERAAAIVTDEGGITSHAAIIARELKIPCIVGCLHAMQLLNDGDVVEVNAEKGIVKILK